MNQQTKHTSFQKSVAIILTGSLFLQGWSCNGNKFNMPILPERPVYNITHTATTPPPTNMLTDSVEDNSSIEGVTEGIEGTSTLPVIFSSTPIDNAKTREIEANEKKCKSDPTREKGKSRSTLSRVKRRKTEKNQEEVKEENRSNDEITFNTLPSEIQCHILAQLPTREVAKCKFVNKNFKEVAAFILKIRLEGAVKRNQIKVSCLQDAIMNNDSKSLSKLLDLGLDPNFLCCDKDHEGIPLIHLATEQGNLEILELLLKRGAKVDTKDNKGLNALYKANEIYKKTNESYKKTNDQYYRDSNGRILLGGKYDYKRDLGILHLLMNYYKAIYPLHEAIRKGDTQEVSRLLDVGADIEFLQHTEESKYLLSLGAKIHHIDYSHEDPLKKGRRLLKQFLYKSPLCTAIECKNLAIVKQLLASGASTEPQTDIFADTKPTLAPLHMAAKVGDLEIFNLLLENGANINTQIDGNTVLHFAAEGGHLELINLVLDQGLSVYTKNASKEYALHIAARHGNLEAFELLISRRVGMFSEHITVPTLLLAAIKGDNIELIKLILRQGADVNIRDSLGDTLLHLALRKGNVELVKLLLDEGAKVNTREKLGRTPLHLAAELLCLDTQLSQSVRSRNIEVIKLLLAKSEDLNARDNHTNTPLHLAAQSGEREIVKLLLENKPDINARNNFGNTPLHLAIRSGKIETVKLLIENGADINVRNDNSDNLLHLAAQSGNIELLELLANIDQPRLLLKETPQAFIEFKDLINGFNSRRSTPLHVAVEYDKLASVNFFLEQGTDVNAKDGDGNSPLHVAAKRDYVELASFLLENGANINAINNDGKPPFCEALKSGNIELAEFLAKRSNKITVGDNISYDFPFLIFYENTHV